MLRFGYACGAVRVTTDERSESTGPRAHVVGFLNGLRAVGVDPRVYLAGDEAPSSASRPGAGASLSRTAPQRLASDLVRLGLRYGLRRRAVAKIGSVDVLYERLATLQDIGRAFRRRGSCWVVESNGPFWYEAAEERKILALVKTARRVELDAYRDADLVVAVSESLKEIIVRESGRREDDVYVLPNATDAVRFDPSLVTPTRLIAGPVIGFAGYMGEWAGLDNLIWALARLQAAGRPLNAVLIGDGPARAELERQAAREGVASVIRFTGNLPWGEMPSLLAGLDMAFSGQRQMRIGAMYHSPQKIYEYQAMALPVIASDHVDARRLIGETNSGWLFDSDDRQGLLEALIAAREDDGLPERGQRARRALLHSHTWTIRVEQLLDELGRRDLFAHRASPDVRAA